MLLPAFCRPIPESLVEVPVDKTKRAAIAVFFLANVIMMVTAALPNKSLLGKKILHGVRYYQAFLGLTQSWSMFAPNPSSRNSYVEAEILFTDGSKERWTFPRPSQMDASEKFLAGERYRKFAQEHLAGKRTQLFDDLGRFTEREVEAIEGEGKKRQIEKIDFYKYTSVVLEPEVRFVPHGQLSSDFKEKLLYSFKLEKKVIHEARNTH